VGRIKKKEELFLLRDQNHVDNTIQRIINKNKIKNIKEKGKKKTNTSHFHQRQ